MAVFSVNFSEASLDSSHWILNAMDYWWNPGWWSDHNENAIYDPSNNRIILQGTTNNNSTGSATLHGFNISSGYSLVFDLNMLSSEVFSLIFNKTSDGNEYYLTYSTNDQKLRICKQTDGNEEELGSIIESEINGTIMLSIQDGTLLATYEGTTIYTCPFTDEISEGLTFMGGSGNNPTSPIFISNVQLTYGGTDNTPIAQFTEVIQGLTALFTDESTNSPTSWEWDFGDGNTSTIQNPTHTYSSFGDYGVSLIVSNGEGTSTAYTKIIHLRPLNIVNLAVNVYANEYEATVYALIGNKLYWSNDWGGSGIGHLYVTDVNTKETTLLVESNCLASWQCTIHNNKIYRVGQERDSNNIFRAMIQQIDGDNVTTVLKPATDDINELIGVDNDGTYILAGERAFSSGVNVSQSNYPEGCGIWKIPIATFEDTNTWVRVWEDPLGYQPTNILYFDNSWYILLNQFEPQGIWRLVKITDLNNFETSLSTELNFTGNNPANAVIGNILQAGDNLIVMELDTSVSPQKYAMWVLSAGVWNKHILLDIPNNYQHSLNAYYDAINDKVVLIVSRIDNVNWNQFSHKVYSMNTDGTELTDLNEDEISGAVIMMGPHHGGYAQLQDGSVAIPISWATSTTSKINLYKLNDDSADLFTITHIYIPPEGTLTPEQKINKSHWKQKHKVEINTKKLKDLINSLN